MIDPLNDDKSRLELLCYWGSDKDIVEDARTSYGTERTKAFTDKDAKLLAYLIEHRHTSPFRGSGLKFLVKAPLFICRQWWKHVVASANIEEQIGWNEQCFSGSQAIRSWWGKEFTVEQLYEYAEKGMTNYLPFVRSVNSNGEIVKNKIKDVWKSAHQKVYKVTSDLGFEIQTSANHKYLTPDGYRRLEDLKPGDEVMMNGIPAWKSREWMVKNYANTTASMEDVAALAGCSAACIRKWARIHGIRLSRAEQGRRRVVNNRVWGKGETKQTNNAIAERGKKTGDAQRGIGKASGSSNGNYRHDNNISPNAGHWRARRQYEKDKCLFCSEAETLEIHHVNGNPVDNSPENIEVVCRKHHDMRHGKQPLLAPHPVKIKSIELIGEMDTYDIEMEGDSNLVVSNFVVHNSFRYTEPPLDFYIPTRFRAQSKANKQMSEGRITVEQEGMAAIAYRTACAASAHHYKELLQCGVGREQARAVLNPAVYTTWVWTASLQTVLHFISLRVGKGAQAEITAYAEEIERITTDLFPHTMREFRSRNYEGF